MHEPTTPIKHADNNDTLAELPVMLIKPAKIPPQS